MSSIKRVYRIIYGLVMLLCAVMITAIPRDGAIIVVAIIDIVLLLYGMKMLIYYITLARYMVGGIMTLYKSIIVIDFGLFVFNLYEAPYRLVLLYLIGIMILNSARVILSSLEIRRLENPAWKRRFVYGVVKLMIVVLALFMYDSTQVVTIIFSAGLIHSAIYSISTAFKKSAIIYIG